MEGGDSAEGDACSRFAARPSVPRTSSAARRASASLDMRSVHLCLAFAVVAYVTVGACGYALYGDDTRDNILLNARSPALDAAMTVYQALCFRASSFVAPRVGVLRSSTARTGRFRTGTFAHAPRVAGMLAAALMVAAKMPHSAFLFALTGAVGVCAVCRPRVPGVDASQRAEKRGR